jgi:hypothetical protein
MTHLSPGKLPFRWRVLMIPLVAAAMVAIGAYAILGPSSDAVTGGALAFDTDSPRGDVSVVPSFVWHALSGAQSFRLSVVDETAGTIFEARVTATRYVVPPDMAGKLQRGTKYDWLVESLDANGKVIDTTPLTEFTIVR